MSKILRYAKFAEEATYRADPSPAPQFTVDIASASLDSPSDSQLVWEGGLGRGPRTHRPGYYSTAGNVALALDLHTIGWLLRWTLGGAAFTTAGGTGGLNLHEFYGSDDTLLPSFVVWLGKDVFEHAFKGCVASQLSLEVSDGFCQATLDVVGAEDAKGALDPAVVASLPLAVPRAFPDMRFYLGGTDAGSEISAAVQELTLTINNNADAAAARGLGSRFPRRKIPAGQRETTLELTVRYESTAHLERLWGGPSGPSTEGTAETPARIVADGGAEGSLTIDLPRCIITEVQQQPSGRDRIDQSLAVTALLDTVTLEDTSTVESEIYCRLENDQPQYQAA